MNIIQKDITTITTGIIGHQCNCQGVMGAGVAKAIRTKWPMSYAIYRDAYNNHQLYLGNAVYAKMSNYPPLTIVHLCGQDGYGAHGINTDYNALEHALGHMKNIQLTHAKLHNETLPLYLPYGIGCGLAGGEWQIVETMIEKIMPDVTLCKWRG